MQRWLVGTCLGIVVPGVDPATGGEILSAWNGGAPNIALLELADGTLTAIGVGYPGISREPVVLGPEPRIPDADPLPPPTKPRSHAHIFCTSACDRGACPTNHRPGPPGRTTSETLTCAD